MCIGEEVVILGAWFEVVPSYIYVHTQRSCQFALWNENIVVRRGGSNHEALSIRVKNSSFKDTRAEHAVLVTVAELDGVIHWLILSIFVSSDSASIVFNQLGNPNNILPTGLKHWVVFVNPEVIFSCEPFLFALAIFEFRFLSIVRQSNFELASFRNKIDADSLDMLWQSQPKSVEPSFKGAVESIIH